MAEKFTIERAALGRQHVIGDFYDACSDSFVHGNLFKEWVLPSSLVNVLKAPSTEAEFQFTNSTKEKLKVLKLEGEVSLSFLCGLISVEGSAKFLKEDVTNSKCLHWVLTQKVQTQIERVNLGNKKILAELVNETSISSETTHVVVGIRRGCNALVDFSFASDETTSKFKIEGVLKGALRQSVFPIGGDIASKVVEESKEANETIEESVPSASSSDAAKVGLRGEGKYGNTTKDINSSVKLKVFADIAPPSSCAPQTIEEGAEALRIIRQELEKTGNGAGVPITYELMSIAEVKRQLGIITDCGTVCSILDSEIIEKAKTILYEAEEQVKRINDLAETMEHYVDSIPEDKVAEIHTRRDECLAKSTEIRTKIRTLLCIVREDTSKLDQLLDVFTTFRTSPLHKPNMDTFFKLHKDVFRLYEFLDKLKKHNINILHTKNDYWLLKQTGISYILFFSLKDIAEDKKSWHQTANMFISLCRKKHPEVRFAAVQSDVLTGLAEEEEFAQGFQIVVVKDNEVATEDLMGALAKIPIGNKSYDQDNWAFFNCEGLQHDSIRDLVKAMSGCPSCTENRPVTVKCTKCTGQLKYDGTYLYCGCGRRLFEAFTLIVCKYGHQGHPTISTNISLDMQRYLEIMSVKQPYNKLLVEAVILDLAICMNQNVKNLYIFTRRVESSENQSCIRELINREQMNLEQMADCSTVLTSFLKTCSVFLSGDVHREYVNNLNHDLDNIISKKLFLSLSEIKAYSVKCTEQVENLKRHTKPYTGTLKSVYEISYMINYLQMLKAEERISF